MEAASVLTPRMRQRRWVRWVHASSVEGGAEEHKLLQG